MIVFWILAAGLAGLALLFIVPPILGTRRSAASGPTPNEDQINLDVFRQQMDELDADMAAGDLDQAQYEAARQDLERGLLQDIQEPTVAGAPVRSGRWAAVMLAIAVPAMAVAVYLGVGDHTALEQSATAQAAPAHPSSNGKPPVNVAAMVQRLAARMEKDPNNVNGWIMLGRSYLVMKRIPEAVKAYEKARKLAPDNNDATLGYAEAIARAQQSLQGRPAKLIASVLQVEPANADALWLMGLVEMQRGNPKEALAHWTKLDTMLKPGSQDAATVHKFMNQAREQAGLPTVAEAPPMAGPAMAAAGGDPAGGQAAAGGGKSVKVEVTLADALKGKAAPGDTLFVFARALSGPPMPLAVKRLTAADLPVTVTLDDSMAMMPQMRLSKFPQVVIGARISKSGNPMPHSGDLQGEVKPVTPGQAQTVKVVIDSVQP